MPDSKHRNLLIFAVTVLIVVGIGTPVYIYYYPHLIYNAWDTAIVSTGDGATPNATGIPVNTLYTVTALASPSTHTNLAGANHDTLSTPHSRPEQRAAGFACAGDGRAILQHRVRRPLG
jgi:hypothetical protein